MNFESQPEHSGNSFLRKKFKELPVFFPVDYKNSNALGVVRTYKLNVGQRIFMTFKDQRGSKLGMIIRVVTKLAIIVNAGAYVWSWSPVNMVVPTSCSNPACANDVTLCPGAIICEPHLDVRMLWIQIFCMLVLLANFTIPALLCWTVPARLAGVLDLKKESQKADELLENARDDDEDYPTRKRVSSVVRSNKRNSANSKGNSDKDGKLCVDVDPDYSFFVQMYRYCTAGRSLRALAGNIPLFIVFLTVSDRTEDGLFVYIARMTTLVQLVDFISGKKTSQVTRRTLARAYPTMLFMIWCILLLAVVVGAIIFLLERGEFTVTEDYPDGAFLRPTVTGRGKEESPFTSMALSLYWVVVTITSVGYGELVCTSAYGRLISVMLMILSIFVLALPIAVIGQILTEEMENYVELKAQKETRVAKQIGIDESSDLLKKYSSAIERRKSQFKFELPGELKAAAEKRENKLRKINSANDVLRSDSSEKVELSSKKKSISFSIGDDKSVKKTRTSASKLFNSWSENDEKSYGSDDSPSEDPPNDDNRLLDGDADKRVVTTPQVEFILGSSTAAASQSKSVSRVEAKWNESISKEQIKVDQTPKALSPVNRSPLDNNINRKNPMLRPAMTKKIMSEPALYKKIGSTSMSSSSSRLRDIDKEIRILESAYLKQMQDCTEIHRKIVALMKEKNAALHEAIL